MANDGYDRYMRDHNISTEGPNPPGSPRAEALTCAIDELEDAVGKLEGILADCAFALSGLPNDCSSIISAAKDGWLTAMDEAAEQLRETITILNKQ